MSKRCIYTKYYHSKPEDHMDGGFITYNMGSPLKKLGVGHRY